MNPLPSAIPHAFARVGGSLRDLRPLTSATFLFLPLCLLPVGPLPADTGTPGSVAPAGASASPLAATASVLTCLGQDYFLAQSSGLPGVETHEYTLSGETLRDWSQLVTLQRVSLKKPALPADFITFSRLRLEREGGATFLTAPGGRRCGLFTAHFAKTAEQDEQIVICLVVADSYEPTCLQVIQYAAKPSRLTPALLEIQLRGWRERLGEQASKTELAGAKTGEGS